MLAPARLASVGTLVSRDGTLAGDVAHRLEDADQVGDRGVDGRAAAVLLDRMLLIELHRARVLAIERAEDRRRGAGVRPAEPLRPALYALHVAGAGLERTH